VLVCALDLKGLKVSLSSGLRKLTGELMLNSEQKKMLRDLFSEDEQSQMEAAVSLGKSRDMRLLAMLQFYMQDDFLDELLAHIGGAEFHYRFAQKGMIKFYSVAAASNMLSDPQFFESVLSAVMNPSESVEERCDILSVLGCVFEKLGSEAHMRDAAYVSERVGWQFVKSALSLLSSDKSEEVRVACAMALSKAVTNPSIRTNLDPGLAKQSFDVLKAYGEVV